ncbi:MAG: hypothetical protein AMJ69_05950 [Gammaproteobacteria bacterium SG8_47]|nr:MAG: hypothetical protein AMJ69_05950 [Gammaproteobacteria bacterium SG8_47]
MEPYAYLQQVAARLDSLRSAREINPVLDELEFLYEALDPELQDLATDLIATLTKRLNQAS